MRQQQQQHQMQLQQHCWQRLWDHLLAMWDRVVVVMVQRGLLPVVRWGHQPQQQPLLGPQPWVQQQCQQQQHRQQPQQQLQLWRQPLLARMRLCRLQLLVLMSMPWLHS